MAKTLPAYQCNNEQTHLIGGVGLCEDLDASYERDSRWKPHLSWSFFSWSLQQKMEEQAVRRELAWQRVVDKLGPLLIHNSNYSSIIQDCHNNQYLYSDGYQNSSSYSLPSDRQSSDTTTPPNQAQDSQHRSQSGQSLAPKPKLHTLPQYQSQCRVDFLKTTGTPKSDICRHQVTSEAKEEYKLLKQHRRARRRSVAISGFLLLVSLILFTIVTLVAFGVIQPGW